LFACGFRIYVDIRKVAFTSAKLDKIKHNFSIKNMAGFVWFKGFGKRNVTMTTGNKRAFTGLQK
jgi:hypothetical protein